MLIKNRGVIGFIGGLEVNLDILNKLGDLAEELDYEFKVIEFQNSHRYEMALHEVGQLMQCTCYIIDIANFRRNLPQFPLEFFGDIVAPIFFISDDKTESNIASIKINSVYKNDKPSVNRMLQKIKRWVINLVNINTKQKLIINPEKFDIRRLEPRAFENLCFELLQRFGMRNPRWNNEYADIIGTMRKKDPDGFEYEEIWFVFIGENAKKCVSYLEYEAFINDVIKMSGSERKQTRSRQNYLLSPPQYTFLLVPYNVGRGFEDHLQEIVLSTKANSNVRIRNWSNEVISTLLTEHPGLAYKYFYEGSNEGSHRKSYEELNRENVELANRLRTNVIQLKDEQKRRVLAERDAVWKEVSVKAAHKLGNPIYQADNWIVVLEHHIDEEGQEYLIKLRTIIEKAKAILEQFKYATKLYEVKPVPTDLRLLCESIVSCGSFNNIKIEVVTPLNEPITALIDQQRIEEVIDELIRNASTKKGVNRLQINISKVASKDLPDFLEKDKKYVLMKIIDNGPGIQVADKEKVFLPFHTTNPHGTGLGLPIVRKIIEAHGGAIRESGVPNEGAVFEIYLPV